MKRIIAISLACLTLALSLKIGVAYHFCCGKLAQTVLFVGHGKATCGMEEKINSCKNQTQSKGLNTPCCEDKIQQIVTDNFQTDSKIDQIFSNFISFIPQFTFLNFNQEVISENFLGYRPPPNLTTVSLSLIRVFLI